MHLQTSTPLLADCSGIQKVPIPEFPARRLSWDVDIPDDGKTAEQFLREHGCSHRVLTHLKRTENGICKNGTWTYANQRLRTGDHLTITITESAASVRILPVPLPFTVVYEDEDLLVVNKPCGMPVHPSMGNYDNTLANAAMYHCRNRPFVFRCINRLDRDTSGLLVIAKNMYSGAVLSGSLSSRQIHREYLAIAEGILPVSQTIDAPIARKPGSALMRCVDREHGERAVTHVRRLARFERKKGSGGTALPPYLSLASVHLETGRTHQIRVHLAYTGHPLPGDFLYNPPHGFEIPDAFPAFSGDTASHAGICAPVRTAFPQHPDYADFPSDTVPHVAICAPDTPRSAMIRRQALHSFRLAFPHPVTGQLLCFESVLPDDMRRLLTAYDRIPDGCPTAGTNVLSASVLCARSGQQRQNSLVMS